MTTITMDTQVASKPTFWKRFNTFCEIVGYSRAASHLASLGYHKEAKACMMQIAKLKRS